MSRKLDVDLQQGRNMGVYSTRSRRMARRYMTREGYTPNFPTATNVSYDRWLEKPYSDSDSAGMSRLWQTTTSYRSGGSTHRTDVRVDEDRELLTGGSWASKARALSEVVDSDFGESTRASSYDNGHPFVTEKRWISGLSKISESNTLSGTNGGRYSLDGWILPVITGRSQASLWPVAPAFDSGVYGTEAIAKTKPQPYVDLLLTLSELKKEGLPRLPELASIQGTNSFAKVAADGYLSSEFGFKPLGSELGKLAHAVVDSERILKQYERDAGKHVRRRFVFPEEVSVSERPTSSGILSTGESSTGCRPWRGYNQPPPCQIREEVSTYRRISFSGAYMYHLPVSREAAGKMERFAQKANHLLGLELTPEVLWNLAPWSWLSDWNLNVGHVLSNVESFKSDGLVLKYGYVMCETISRRTLTALGPVTLSGNAGPFTVRYNLHRKERVRARPYGFGTNPDQYTDRQWSILAALGISRGSRRLP